MSSGVTATAAPAVVPVEPYTASGSSPGRAKPPFTAVRTVRVGLLGLGTVGQGLCALLDRKGSEIARRHGVSFAIQSVLVRDPARRRGLVPAGARLTADPEAFLDEGYDLAVEALGGVDPAGPLVGALLARGVPVVTANKAILAKWGETLADIARKSGAAFRYEASVAAGIPLVGLLERSLLSTAFTRVTGILNATSNFVLTRVARAEETLGAALAEARRKGFAEADPSLDLSGVDAGQKLAVLIRLLARRAFSSSPFEVTGSSGITSEDCARAAAFGCVIKPIAFADLSRDPVRGYVAPALVPDGHPLARVDGAQNGVLLAGDTVEELFLAGPGAGGLPTAASLLDDMIAIAAGGAASPPPPGDLIPAGRPTHDVERVATRWFVALEPGAATLAHPEDFIQLAGAAGLAFLELRRLHAPAGPAIVAGITARATSDRVDAIRERLESASLVKRFRAFRVVDDGEEGAR